MKTHCLRSLVGASLLAIAAISASLVACSAEDATELESEGAELESEGVEAGGVDTSIPLEDKYDMELTADERARLDAHYASQGMPEDQVSYRGRVITVEGDMLVDADYILSGLERVEKGQVNHGSGGFGQGSLARCNGGVPSGNECPTGKFQFFRPWIDDKYFVIVDDFTFNKYYLDLVTNAAAAVENISGDKPGANLYDVVTPAQYAARPAADQFRYVINVVISTTACTGANTLACMEVPVQTTEQTPTGQQTRMRLGRRLGIRQDKIQDATGTTRLNNIGVITHELLHSLGIGHVDFPDPSFQIYVPGTAKAAANPLSVMWGNIGNSRWKNTPQADDIDMMQTLYRPGLAYVHAFSTVNAN